MSQELHDTMRGTRVLVAGRLLEEIPAQPGLWLLPWRHTAPHLYAIPDGAGGYEWAPWHVARQRGWSEVHRYREYQGEELERRFLVLYYPPRRSYIRALGRRVESQPLRLALCRNQGEAEAAGERFVPRRQLGFFSLLDTHGGLLRTWGWTDREVGYHESCFAGCGCNGPDDREFLLIAEFENEALAVRPDVRLEPRAWHAALTVERAMELTNCRVGEPGDPACPGCSASDEEIEAAWAWRTRHHRQVMRWLRERSRLAPTTTHPGGQPDGAAGRPTRRSSQ